MSSPGRPSDRQRFGRGLLILVLVGIVAVVSAQSLRHDSDLRNKLPYRSPQPIMVEANQADAHEFELLPGIGPKLAERIVEHRNENGPFTSIDDLGGVPGIGEKTLRTMRRYCELDSSVGSISR